MGRPSKLRPETRERILAVLRDGGYRGLAARYAGVGESTLYRWMADPRPGYREFREAVERAEAEAEMTAVAVLRKQMQKNPRAAIWWLERRVPEWRRPRLPPPEPVPVTEPPAPSGPTFLVSREELERLRGRWRPR